MKMLKYLVAFLAIGAVTVDAQGPLPYQVVLDPDFIVSWGLNASTEVMTVEIYADTIGWAMLKILSPSGTLLDVWWGGYDQDYNASYIEDGNAQLVNLEVGPTYPDTIQDLTLIGAVQPPSQITRLRFRRPYITGDRADVQFASGQSYTVIWSFAADDEPQSPAIRGGSGSITWLPIA